ncbi:3137_t:CDS:2 [Ambispora gerdemannii]|uniref:3137_t:CDS:1 n=1 Tax=Ambispora gerdemannii TaxID=144530 RepID=A0A9N9F9H0_9GLOM|nr:3137_t:CDS:2 [Ambispora gerdemannii]
MTDYMSAERPHKRAYHGSPSSYFDDEQYFEFNKAAADFSYLVNTANTNSGNTNISAANSSSIMPVLQQSGSLSGGNKEGTARELSSSGNSLNHFSNRPEALDDGKIAINKGTDASTDVVPNTNDSCKAEPSNHKEIADINGNKIGKSNSSKSPQLSQLSNNNNNKTFKTNTSPNSKVREALAEKVNMSERSIQIWFQNRRAKMKAMQKRVHMLHEETMKAQLFACMPGYGGHSLYPFRMSAIPRSYSSSDISAGLNSVTAGINPGMRASHPAAGLGISMPQGHQGFWSSGPMTAPIPQLNSDHSIMNGFPFTTNPQPRFPNSPNASPNSNHGMTSAQTLRLVVSPNNPTGGIPMKINDISNTQPQQFTPPQEFLSPSFSNGTNDSPHFLASETLTIGTWRRISTTPTDLLCYYTLQQKLFTYHITNNNRHFKMEFPLSEITAVEFRPIDNVSGQIVIEVRDPPNFFMEGAHGQWTMCTDFTEDRQATRHMRHVMKGRSEVLKKQVFKFTQDDAQIAKVTTIHDEVKHEIDMNLYCGDDSNGEQQQQHTLPRRSSFPSGSIAENLRFEDGSQSDKEVDIRNAEILKQHTRVRRAASVPLSPSDDSTDHSSALATATSAMAQNAALQINTSVALLDIFKAGHISSPEFCSSPMDINSASPATPSDVYNQSPELINTSPLLAQDPFVTLPENHLTNMSIDTTSLYSDDLTVALNANGLPNVTNEDFASIFAGSHSSEGSDFLTFGDTLGNDNLSSSNHGLGLDDSWVNGDVAYC